MILTPKENAAVNAAMQFYSATSAETCAPWLSDQWKSLPDFPQDKAPSEQMRWLVLYVLKNLKFQQDNNTWNARQVQLHGYLPWLVGRLFPRVNKSVLFQHYETGAAYFFEDLRGICDDLELFQRNRANIVAAGNSSEITSYQTYLDVKQVVNPYQKQKPISDVEYKLAKKRFISRRKDAQAQLLGKSRNGSEVILLNSIPASRALGSKAWCTVYNPLRWFASYREKGGLILIVDPPDQYGMRQRYQFHIVKRQFFDSLNREISDLPKFLEARPGLLTMLRKQFASELTRSILAHTDEYLGEDVDTSDRARDCLKYLINSASTLAIKKGIELFTPDIFKDALKLAVGKIKNEEVIQALIQIAEDLECKGFHILPPDAIRELIAFSREHYDKMTVEMLRETARYIKQETVAPTRTQKKPRTNSRDP